MDYTRESRVDTASRIRSGAESRNGLDRQSEDCAWISPENWGKLPTLSEIEDRSEQETDEDTSPPTFVL